MSWRGEWAGLIAIALLVVMAAGGRILGAGAAATDSTGFLPVVLGRQAGPPSPLATVKGKSAGRVVN